jgi:hypothetical protein
MLTIAGDPSQTIVSCNYVGADAVDLFDNPTLGWLVDETSGEPPTPVITGTLPPPAPSDAGAFLSPQWAHLTDSGIFVPDAWRGPVYDFFTWIATNNGAKRRVRGNFSDTRLIYALTSWAQQNPALFNPTPF